MTVHLPHPQYQPSHFTMSRGLASLGRGPDSTLVHMSNAELAGLKQLAHAAGGSITTNPYTGLPEAGFLDSILPVIAGGLLSLTGVGAVPGALMVGGATGLLKKDWKAGLMAGLGAFGGAGLASNLAGAGAEAAATAGQTAATDAATTAATDAATTAATDAATTEASINPETIGSAGFTAPQAASTAMTTAQRQAAEQAAAHAISSTGSPSMATLQGNLQNLGQGIKGLGSTQGWSDLYAGMGKTGLAALSAPALYNASYNQPTLPSKPDVKYYNTRYHPGTPNPYYGQGQLALTGQGYDPGTWSSTYPYSAGGYQAGGFVPASGGSTVTATPPPDQSAIRAYYQSLLQPPTSGMPFTPPPPTANAAYMAGLNASLVPQPRPNPVGPNNPVVPQRPGGPILQPGPVTPPRPVSGGFTGLASQVASQFPNASAWNRGINFDPSTQTYSGIPSTPVATQTPTSGGLPGQVFGGISQLANQAAAQGSATYYNPLTQTYGSAPSTATNPVTPPTITPPTITTQPTPIYPYARMASGGITSLDPRLIRGPGDGMSDSIPAMIQGNKPERAALGDGEFVVPADVVSHIGNGSTDAGAKRLYSMMDRIRLARTGNKSQAKEIDAERYMPV